MADTSIIGIDLAKSVFQVHGVNAKGQTTLKRKLKQKDVIALFKNLPPRLVGTEACGTAHYWARELQALGHTVKLLPPLRRITCVQAVARKWEQVKEVKEPSIRLDGICRGSLAAPAAAGDGADADGEAAAHRPVTLFDLL